MSGGRAAQDPWTAGRGTSTHPIQYNAVLGAKIDRHLRRLKITAPRTINVDDSETLVALVADNQGWAVTTPLCLLQGRQHAKQVQAIKLPGPAATRDTLLVIRTGEYPELSR